MTGKFRFLVAVVFIACLATLAGCGSKNAEPAAPAPPSSQSTKPGPSAEKPLTDEECQSFAETVERAVRDGDALRFNRMIDWDAMLEKGLAGIDAPLVARQAFMREFKGPDEAAEMAKEIVAAVAKGGSYKLLRIHALEGQKRALFRLINPDGGLNYHDLLLERRPGAQIRSVDMYIFMGGELQSGAARRGFLPAAAQASGKLSETEQAFVNSLPKVQEMISDRRAGRFEHALHVYEQLPASVKKDKNVLLIRLGIARAASDHAYEAAIQDFRTHHAGDACVDFLSLDYYALKKQFPRVLEMLDRVDKAVGGDPYLDFLRASIHLQANDSAAARKAAEKAIEQESTLQDAYWVLVTISLKEKKFDDTLKHLKAIAEKFGGDFADFTTLPAYAEFVKSPQYKEWLKSRQKK